MAAPIDEMVTSDMHYLERNEMYKTEKPYSLRFPPNGIPEFPQSNVKRAKHQIQLRNMRKVTDLNVDTCGFGLLRSPCTISYEDFKDRTKIQHTYLTDLCSDLKTALKANLVRRRHESFPISTGENYGHDQPTAMAHIDFTVQEGERMIRILFGQAADKVLQGRWQIMNAWRPIRGPLNDWPLGLCDTRTVDFATDTMPGDIVFRKFVTENLQIHHNPRQAWYWLPGQTVDEVLIFKSAESDGTCAQGMHNGSQSHILSDFINADKQTAVPHAGFYNPNVTPEDLPRESIDCRLLGMGLQPNPVPAPKALHHILNTKSSSTDVHMVLLPGIGTSSGPEWGICQSSWLKTFAQQDQSISIHWYEHGISSNLSSWDIILEEGGRLLTALYHFEQQHNLTSNMTMQEPQPIIFVAHSFGGFILKQAISIAGIYYGRYSKVLNAVAGIVFLGTPHHMEGVSEEDYGERISCMLRATPGLNLNRQILSKLKESSGVLRDIAMRFSLTNFRVDILSVFETKVTKLRDGRILQKNKKIVVVDRALSKIGSSLEQQLGLDLDHLELPLLTGSNRNEPEESSISWLLSVIGSSVANLRGRLIRALTTSVTGPSSSQDAQHGSISTGLDSHGAETTESPVNVESLIEALTPQQTEPQVPCFMVDTFVRNVDFFGRDDVLIHLDECLLPSKTLVVASQPDRTRVGILSGMAGLGKTEVAIEYAYSRQDMFDCIFWVRAEDISKLETDIAQIASRLGIQDPSDPHNKTVNRGLAIGWLTNPFKIDRSAPSLQKHPASWLVVFDNADDPDILMPYREIAHCGAVLITSRNPLSKNSFSSSAVGVELGLFNDEEAGRFLQEITNVRGHEDEAELIGSKLGGLPIAIAQMGGMIRLQYLSFSEFLDIYEEPLDETEVIESEPQPLRPSARGNISTIWAVEKLSDEARSVVEIVAFLDPDGIQDGIISPSSTELTSTPNYPKKKSTFYKARTELMRSSLIRRNDELGEIWVHRVVQHSVRAKMSSDHRLMVFSAAVSRVASEWPSSLGAHDPSLWKAMEAIYPHVVTLRDNYLKYFSGEFVSGHIALAGLMNRAAWYQHERGASHNVRPLLLLALDICGQSQQVSSVVQDLESDIRYSLGAVANETNDATSCLEHNKRFLDIRLDAKIQYSTIDERLARAYNQLGTGWMMAGEYEKAESCFANSISTYQALPGYDRGMRSIPMANLGLAYWLQGRLGAALSVLEEGLSDREEDYGCMDTHSFRTGRFLHALGNVYFDQGQVEKSDEFHRRALAQYQSTIGNHHHRTADVCHKVAQHCLRNGHKEQAERLVDQALSVWSVDKSAYLPEIARTTFLKAKVAMAAAREAEAIGLYRKAASMRKGLTSQARKHDQLSEADFDELVTFWSR
ncbi:tetratricopeptide repeat domain-containing protein [Apiospora saccharicola]